MKKSSVSRTRRITYFQILCYALERCTRTHNQTFLGRQVDVVQEFTTIQNFGRNWWWANGIRVEYFPRIHHIAALQQSPRVPVKNDRKNPEEFTGRIIFMSMFNDISWGPQDNEQECELCANFVSIYARRFSPGRWSFLGPGSEKKWYPTCDSKPQGEWDRVAELMMKKFGESGHPVFRSTRNAQKQRRWKMINTLLRWWGNDWNFLHNYFC